MAIKKGHRNKNEIKRCVQKIIKEITIPPSSENFFKSNFDIANENFEQIYCIPFNATIYTKLRAFQFKINHNILYTNEKLHNVKLSDTPLCTFCNNEIETLVHLFVECNKVTNVWQEVIDKLLQPFGVTNLTKSEIILGVETTPEQNEIINHIILEVKYYIYVCKLEKCNPLFNRIKNRLKITERIENEIAFKAKKLPRHAYKWHHLKNYLLN